MKNNPLHDAIKSPISVKGYALLQWKFIGNFPAHSLQMPEEVVDYVLKINKQHIRKVRRQERKEKKQEQATPTQK